MKRYLFVCLALFLALGCSDNKPPRLTPTGEQGRFLRNGTPDSTSQPNFPNVGKLIIEFSGGQGICTGTLIRPYVVLTAGHCLAGAIGITFELPNGSRSEAIAALIHPKFDVNTAEADIGLVSLASPLTLAKTLLIETAPLLQGTLLSTAGYGITENGTFPSQLLTATVQYQGPLIRFFVPSPAPPNPRPAEAFEFIPTSSNQMHCNGDSGAPLLTPDGKIAGVLSTTTPFIEAVPSCQLNDVGQATDARIYSGWILRNADGLNRNGAFFAVGPGSGLEPIVGKFSSGQPQSILAYQPEFKGDVHVAMGDVDGDGFPEIITGPGAGGGPHVRIFKGTDNTVLAEYFAYGSAFTGGVFVAAGDVNGDGKADVVTGAGAGGGPHVFVRDGASNTILHSFFAYHPAFSGGVRVAAADVNGDGYADIITAPGPGGGPHVRVFNGRDLSIIREFFAYDSAFTGGVYIAGGDVDGDGFSDVMTGAGAGGGPHVIVRSGKSDSVLHSFFAYHSAFSGGVRVSMGDLNNDGRADMITGAGPGGGPHVIARSGLDLNSILGSFFPYDPAYSGGVHVAGWTF